MSIILRYSIAFSYSKRKRKIKKKRKINEAKNNREFRARKKLLIDKVLKPILSHCWLVIQHLGY